MAISATEFFDKLYKESSRFEAKIDSEIESGKFTWLTKTKIMLTEVKTVPFQFRDILIEKYDKSGWILKFVENQKDAGIELEKKAVPQVVSITPLDITPNWRD